MVPALSSAPMSRSSSPPAPAISLSSGQLCREAGVTRGMLRLYEREALLGAPPRSASGYRQYPAEALPRLQAIRQLKAAGFTLREIAWLMSERDQGALGPAALRRLAREQVLAIDQRIAQLQVVRELAEAVATGHTALMDDPECGFLLRFLAAGSQGAGAVAAKPHPRARRAPHTVSREAA